MEIVYQRQSHPCSTQLLKPFISSQAMHQDMSGINSSVMKALIGQLFFSIWWEQLSITTTIRRADLHDLMWTAIQMSGTRLCLAGTARSYAQRRPCTESANNFIEMHWCSPFEFCSNQSLFFCIKEKHRPHLNKNYICGSLKQCNK